MGKRLRKTTGVAAAGTVAGTVAISLAVAHGTLLFRGPLEASAPVGIGLALFGGLVIGLVVGLTSQFGANIAGPQDAPALVIGLAAATIGTTVAPTAAEDTVIVLVLITTAATGLFLFVIGYLRLGTLVRFLPFPVIAGFLGGTGVLLVLSTLDLVLGDRPFGELVDGDVAPRWVPAVGLAVALVVVTRRGLAPHLSVSGLIVGAGVLFHFGLILASVNRAEALRRGWLLGPFPDGILWRPGAALSLGAADWSAITDHLATVVAVVGVSAVAVLLHTAGLESELELDVDVDRELRSTGAANLAAAAVAGSPGYMYLGNSVMVARIATPTRAIAVVSACMVGATMLVGTRFLSLIPVSLSAGILLFIGATFILDWIYDVRHRMALTDYALVLVIAVAIAVAGFLPGVALGIVVAMTLFVVRYSRTDVIRHELDGTRRRSNVAFTPAELAVLNAHGRETAVLELQGYIFFGTADRILAAVQRRVDQDPPLRDVVLDFRRVTGLDSSASVSFAKIARLGQAEGFTLLLTNLDESMAARLEEDLRTVSAPEVTLLPDLDRGMQRAEERILASHGPESSPSNGTALAMVAEVLGEGSALERHLEELGVVQVPSGSVLLERGEATTGIYFLEDGRLTVELAEGSSGPRHRQRSLGSGTVVGEMGWYLDGRCTATVVADGPCLVRHLDVESLSALDEQSPEVVSDLHLYVARTLAERLRHSNDIVQHLLR